MNYVVYYCKSVEKTCLFSVPVVVCCVKGLHNGSQDFTLCCKKTVQEFKKNNVIYLM